MSEKRDEAHGTLSPSQIKGELHSALQALCDEVNKAQGLGYKVDFSFSAGPDGKLQVAQCVLWQKVGAN